MACGGVASGTQKRLNALSTTQAIEWFSGWMSCVGMDDVMPALRGRACSSDYLEAQVVVQVAKVRTDDPEDPVTIGSVQTPTSGAFSYNPGLIDISNLTDDAMFIRFGVAYAYTSGQSQAAGDVRLDVAYIRCGDLVGSGSWQLDSTTLAMRYVVVTGWIPAVLVEAVKLAAVCASLTGNLQWRLAYRVAATSQSEPGSWSNVTDAGAPYTSGDINTGDLSLSLGSNMWVQFAISYNLSAAGSGQANLATAVGVRRNA